MPTDQSPMSHTSWSLLPPYFVWRRGSCAEVLLLNTQPASRTPASMETPRHYHQLSSETPSRPLHIFSQSGRLRLWDLLGPREHENKSFFFFFCCFFSVAHASFLRLLSLNVLHWVSDKKRYGRCNFASEGLGTTSPKILKDFQKNVASQKKWNNIPIISAFFSSFCCVSDLP